MYVSYKQNGMRKRNEHQSIILSKMKRKIKYIAYFLILDLFLWTAAAITVQKMKCPKITVIELIMHIPKSIVCNFEK